MRDSLEGTRSCICEHSLAKKRDVTCGLCYVGDDGGVEAVVSWAGRWYVEGEPKGRLVHFPGISHDAIAQESKRYWQNLEANAPGAQVLYHTFLRSVSFLEWPNEGHLADVVSTYSLLPFLLFIDLSYC